MRKTMLIKAKKNENGKWILVAENGDLPQEGFAYDTRKEAYEAASQLWPTNSVWNGRKVSNGYRITID